MVVALWHAVDSPKHAISPVQSGLFTQASASVQHCACTQASQIGSPTVTEQVVPPPKPPEPPALVEPKPPVPDPPLPPALVEPKPPEPKPPLPLLLPKPPKPLLLPKPPEPALPPLPLEPPLELIPQTFAHSP